MGFLKKTDDKKEDKLESKKTPFGRITGRPEEPRQVLLDTKDQYRVYKKLLKKAALPDK
ncbi:MAG: hypothetical protein KAR87_05665 [Candidatus Aenigmarchaeota archaeon]|nr:hypothetical protein [Candidatus Aenigmarchaeota archaeon]